MVDQPGVHIHEVSLPPSISGTAAGTTAFVGRAERGPVDTPTLVTSFPEFERVFGGLWPGSSLGYSLLDFFDQGGRRAIVVRAHRPTASDTAIISFGSGPAPLAIQAASPGAWGRQLEATLTPGRRGSFELVVTDRGRRLSEAFSGLSAALGSRRRVDWVLEAESTLARARAPLPTALPAAPLTVAAVGGTDGGRIGVGSITGPGPRASGRGLYALDGAEDFDLIVIPPYSPAFGVARRVIDETIAYARKRRAMVILDPPPSWAGVDQAATGSPGFVESRDAALYFPRLRRPDPRRPGSLMDVAPSGAVAGVIARHDLAKGVWISPAGTDATLVGAGPVLPLGQRDAERLGRIGVNCIRSIPGQGSVVWGARTRAGDAEAEWKYVAVRRTALFLERSIEKGLEWATFEPNAEPLWARVRGMVGDFLHTLFRQGAFAGNRPDQAYFARCGTDTMTQSDVDDGRLVILIGFAPIRPAEFLLIRIERLLADHD